MSAAAAVSTGRLSALAPEAPRGVCSDRGQAGGRRRSCARRWPRSSPRVRSRRRRGAARSGARVRPRRPESLEVPRARCEAALAALDSGAAAGAGARGPQHRHARTPRPPPGRPRWRRSPASSWAGGRIRSRACRRLRAGRPRRVPQQRADGRGARARRGRGRGHRSARRRARTACPRTAVLAAAALAGVDRVFALGGAGAIAAHGLRHASVPAWTASSARATPTWPRPSCQVADAVAIDSPAGPSELLVLARRRGRRPEAVARELLAQAEHDPEAAVVAVALDDGTARRLLDRVAALAPAAERGGRRQLRARSPRRGARRELARGGGGLRRAVRAEHLLLAVEGAARDVWRASATRARCSLATASSVRVRRLPDRRQPRPSHGGAGARLLGPVHAGLRPLDHLAAVSAEGAAARRGHRGPRRRRGAARPRGRGPRLEDPREPGPASPGAGHGRRCTRRTRRPAGARPQRQHQPLGHAARRRPCAAGSRWPRSRRATRARLRARAPRRARPLRRGERGAGHHRLRLGRRHRLRAPRLRRAGEKLAFSDADLLDDADLRADERSRAGARAVPEGRGHRRPDALLAERAAIIYVCSPNNPTGTGVSAAAIERVVAEAEGLVLVDEAYGEFSGRTAAAAPRPRPELLVTRTLSKAFGLAGLRVGYGLGRPRGGAEAGEGRGAPTR